MSDKAPKRRRTWVNFYEDGSDDGCNFATKTDAKENASTAYKTTQVPFVELRRGDVVLSREEAALIRSTLVRLEEIASEHLGQMQPVSVLPLLRGGR